MATTTDFAVEALAESCVNDMGDIFWDYGQFRDAPGEYADPHRIALESVKKVLREFAEKVDTSVVYPASLRDEYKTVVAALPESPTDRAVIGALVSQSEWTERGAREVVQLARRYGWSILRNALALAEALDIEDGESGL